MAASGTLADLLEREMRRRGWTLAYFADLLGRLGGATVCPSVQVVWNWRSGRVPPGPTYRRLIARALDLPVEAIVNAIALQQVIRAREVGDASAESPVFFSQPSNSDGLSALTDDVIDLAAWVEQTNVGDGTVAFLDEATHRLADNHTRVPPRRMLAHVLRTHRQIQKLLRDGKQRLRQARELFRIEADLLAHSCILLGDLHADEAAIAYGVTAALCADEAGGNRAAALSAQAKTEGWRRHYAESADLARRGFECSSPTPLRVLLASQ